MTSGNASTPAIHDRWPKRSAEVLGSDCCGAAAATASPRVAGAGGCDGAAVRPAIVASGTTPATSGGCAGGAGIVAAAGAGGAGKAAGGATAVPERRYMIRE